MTNMRILLVSALVVGSCLPGYADQASSAYKQGVKAEEQNDYDHAFEAFKLAHEAKPNDPKYSEAYIRLRFNAANEHIRAGQLRRDDGKLSEALTEFQRAVDIDHSSFIAQQEVRRTADMLRKQERHEEAKVVPQSPLAKSAEEVDGPMQLRAIPSATTNLRITETADKIYKTLGKLAGLNVLFDPDYKPQKVTLELNDVTLRDALNMLAMQTKTFWQAVSPNTIFVAGDTAGKRKDLQSNVMKTFYLKNVSTTTELQEAANTVKGMLDVSRVQLIPTQSAIMLRGTEAQLILAEKLFSDIDKPKGEVVIDIAVMQVSRDRLHTLGTNVPTSASISLIPGTGSSGSGSSSGLTLNSLRNLNATNFGVSIPGASLTFLMSDSNSKLIQNPEIRVLDNEKASLKIGDRVPISTGSYQSGVSGGVNTQFQYIDVGVNIDITPHIHSEGEVTLKMSLEISSVTGTENIGGISQPVIGQRKIEHEVRLKDGEVNLIAGILEDSETKSLSGYPWIAKIPVLKYLFGQETKDRSENEIVFSITPHIIRSQEINDQNLRLVDVGAGNAIEVRRRNSTTTEAVSTPSSAGSSVLRAPASTPKPQNAPAVPNATSNTTRTNPPSAMAAPVSQSQNERLTPPPQPRTSTVTLSTQASSSTPAQTDNDPCPYGQHFVQKQGNVAICAYN